METTTKAGQIVKFHTPLENENANQQYVVLEWHEDATPPRAKIKALATGLPFPPVSVVPISDLVPVKANTSSLEGLVVYILKTDSSKVLGRITKVNDENVDLGMEVMEKGVATNVTVTVIDSAGKEHIGILLVT